MQCDEVVRELAVPTDDCDSAALAEHLVSCSACAGWAKRAAQLDRLWATTRPEEPLPEIWDSIWAQVTSSLDSSAPQESEEVVVAPVSANGSAAKLEGQFAPRKPLPRPNPWRLATIGLVGLAQAAAVFLAVALTWQTSTSSRLGQITDHRKITPSPVPMAPGVEIEEGRLVVIRVDGPTARVVDLTPEGISWSVDEWLVMLNEVESMPNSVVAMKE
jgi:hypothetical protein